MARTRRTRRTCTVISKILTIDGLYKTYAFLNDAEVKGPHDCILVLPSQEVVGILETNGQSVVVSSFGQEQEVIDLVLFGVTVHLLLGVRVLASTCVLFR